ncbi:MAG: GNAT family N-acetyltransferase [Bacteroidales bacterium]|nr:GNAT family N-acetyltransferase [Bacteroidales bacterium]
MYEKGRIRNAVPGDLDAVNDLLEQVLAVHHEGRPDLFREQGKKYTDAELLDIFADPDTPVFVYEEDGAVLGYAFCAARYQCSGSLNPVRTLYLDDLCVDGKARGRHIGRALFDYVKSYASEQGFYNITLHVWECNPGARTFYKALGMKPQYTCMELVCGER